LNMKMLSTTLFVALLGSCQAFAPHQYAHISPRLATLLKRPHSYTLRKAVAEGNLQENGRALAERLSGVPVYLIGMMGSGKSSVGDIFCKSLGSYSFLETDSLIETIAGSTVAEVFENQGEEEFRKVESAVLTQVSSFIRTVVSTGGGIVTNEANWGKLQSGIVVFLDVPSDVIAKRMLASDASRAATTVGEVAARPLLAGLDDPTDQAQVAERLQGLLDQRLNKYNQADLAVKFDGSEALDDSALILINKLDSFIASNPPKWKQWKDKATLTAK